MTEPPAGSVTLLGNETLAHHICYEYCRLLRRADRYDHRTVSLCLQFPYRDLHRRPLRLLMDTETLKIAGQIAGIGGLAFGVFLILFREVIRKKMFPMLSQQHAYRVIRLFLVLTFLLALSGIAAWVFSDPGQAQPLPADDGDSSLAFVDIGLSDNSSNSSEFPILDVKLRNKGSTSAFIKRARFEVLDRIVFSDCQHYSAQPVTWTYQVNLEDPKPVPLSQAVPARGVDRFQIVTGHNLRGPNQHAYYKLQLVLESDEDDKRLISHPFTIYLPGMAERYASTGSGDMLCRLALKKALERASSWPVSYSLPNYFEDE